MAMIGNTLRFVCYHQLGQQFTCRLSIVDDHALVTTGPYAVVRHPSYTAWILFMLGLMTAQVGPGSWIYQCGLLRTVWGCAVLEAWLVYNLYIFAMLLPRMRREDDTLRQELGYDWVQWSKTTPYKLLPGLY